MVKTIRATIEFYNDTLKAYTVKDNATGKLYRWPMFDVFPSLDMLTGEQVSIPVNQLEEI